MVDDPSPEEVFSLYQENIIQHLLADRDFFIDCIGQNIFSLATDWSCNVVLSERRLGEAYDFWHQDQKRTLEKGIEGGADGLDHFKHASFISFWLRRLTPINETQRDPGHDATRGQDEQNFFLRYGNEICALLIGYQLCLYYEMAAVADESQGDTVVPMEDWKKLLERTQFTEPLLKDFAMVLKHKNMSPHSLYLLFKSLFANVRPEH